MQPTSAYIDSLRPAGSKRSSKRDLIVNVFLRQEGHLSAEDLVDVIRREDQRISRATVYRTLQWMVDAGIARKVDFGEGRFRFEHSYRHPRHYHLICKTCNRSSEFLSSDIEALVEEVAAARNFAATQSVVQTVGSVSRWMGLDPKDVVVISQYTGGGFGSKATGTITSMIPALRAVRELRPFLTQ